MNASVRKIINQKVAKIKTDDGRELVRRVTTVLCPSGNYRYPVDYYDATPGVVEVTKEELERLRGPVYEQLM